MPIVIVMSITSPLDDPEVVESTIATLLEANGFSGISMLMIEHAITLCSCCGSARCNLNETGLCTNCAGE